MHDVLIGDCNDRGMKPDSGSRVVKVMCSPLSWIRMNTSFWYAVQKGCLIMSYRRRPWFTLNSKGTFKEKLRRRSLSPSNIMSAYIFAHRQAQEGAIVSVRGPT